MNSANGGKSRDLESELLYHPTIYSIDEKRSLKAEDKKPNKMSKLQHCIFTVLLLCLLIVGIVCAALPNKPPQDATQRLSPEQNRFLELLNTVDPSALHEVLHDNLKDKYQHGVFQEDKTAVEAIHQQNAEVAESLIELAKRQATGSGNGTVVTTTAVTTTDKVVTSTDSITSTAGSIPQTTPSSQSSVAPTSQPSTSAPVSSTPSSTPSSTVTNIQTSTAPTTSAPALSSESTPVSTTPSPTSKASKSQSPSQSEAGTSTTPSSSRTTIYTTTMANGAMTTVTSVTVVPAGQADQTTGGSGATTTSGSNASLQTGTGGRMEVGLSAVLGIVGIVVVGAL